MVSWNEYRAQFEADYDALKGELLETGCDERGPFLGATERPMRAPWKMDWVVLFNDGYFVRVKETYRPLPKSKAGQRDHFSYHYGLANTVKDGRGIPKILGAPKPVLRIDVDRNHPHIHMNGEDHIEQARVKGYIIKNADLVQFMRAVIEHRKTRTKSLADLLNISVR
jgi:hypothetical protein